MLAKESIEVASKDNLNARIVYFNTVYSASPAHTAHIVREAVRHAENVSPKMRPVVRIHNLGESSIDWEVKYWPENYARHNDTDALLRRNIWYAFQREKIHFAFPTRSVYMEQAVDDVTLEEKININAERLNQVPIFAPLSDEETEFLAQSARTRIFAPDEPIVRFGLEGKSMFIIVRGKVSVQITEKGVEKEVGTLGENDFFGEMSLLTGEKRTATVVAVEETEVLRIEKTAMKKIFSNNPDLVNSIGEIAAERKEELMSLTNKELDVKADRTVGMLTSIRKFFGLKR